MNATKHEATLDVFGDTLRVQWTGSVWQAPCNGTQHARVEDAMRQELRKYLAESGDPMADDEDAMDELLANIEE